jgi:hypothetical protein
VLDGLAAELNELECPSLRLSPPQQPPYVDVSLPGSMTAGDRIYLENGMFTWRGQPISTAGQSATAAAIIADTLHATGRPRS